MSVPYLVGHFIYNLWAAPWQDNQTWNRLARVTPITGSRNYINVFHEEYNLPTPNDRYHAYVIGQVSEYIFNLPFVEWTDRSKWFNFADICKETNVVFQFYTNRGITVPLTHVYFTLTLDKNVLLVVKEEEGIDWKMSTEDLYFRTYNNAITHVDQSTLTSPEKIDVFYKKVFTEADKLELYQFISRYKNTDGTILCYINGYLVSNIESYPILEKDAVELIFDSTILKVIEMDIATIPTFKSKIDKIRKYLFTHDKSYPKNLFEYHDDCDFNLVFYANKTPKMFKGVMLHKNDRSNIRQVSNCDFSISTNLVSEMRTHYPWIDEHEGKVKFRVYYRKQYTLKKLPYIHNRLHELNRLSFLDRVAAMQGLRSNIEEWRADNLEASMALRLMELEKPICDLEKVQEVYGYNAATYYTGKSFHLYEDFIDDGLGGKLVNVPYAYRIYSTIYEYDEVGRLLTWRRLGDFNQYPVSHPQCRMVEFVSGIGTDRPVEYRDVFDIPVGEEEEFRIYAAPKSQESLPSAWKDITKEPNLTNWITLNDKRHLHINENTTYPFVDHRYIVRTDKYFISKEIEIEFSKGNLQFTMNNHFIKDSKLVAEKIKFPYGYLDVFLNGYALIEGIDYFVEWPNVYICNKKCLDLSKPKQKILYRLTNFPVTKEINNKSILTGITTNRQVGYVNNGMLSRNGKWEIIEDKNFLIRVGNGIIPKENLGFSELGNVIPFRKDDLEGKPYEIRDTIVPKRLTYPKDTYEFKAISDELDSRMADYLGQFFSDTRFPTNPPIKGLYKVFSPVLSRIIYDLSKKSLDILDKNGVSQLEGRYTDQEVIKLIEEKYRDLFKTDPFFRYDEISMKHVTIHPTYGENVTTLSYHQVRLLKRIIAIFFKNEIEISHFIRIGD